MTLSPLSCRSETARREDNAPPPPPTSLLLPSSSLPRSRLVPVVFFPPLSSRGANLSRRSPFRVDYTYIYIYNNLDSPIAPHLSHAARRRPRDWRPPSSILSRRERASLVNHATVMNDGNESPAIIVRYIVARRRAKSTRQTVSARIRSFPSVSATIFTLCRVCARTSFCERYLNSREINLCIPVDGK